jgi:hypothetical protein
LAQDNRTFKPFPIEGGFMSQINIAVIVGSLRRDSFNAKLARAIAKLAPLTCISSKEE